MSFSDYFELKGLATHNFSNFKEQINTLTNCLYFVNTFVNTYE
jgi:hypothetical protein